MQTHDQNAEKKVWTDPHLVRLDRSLADSTEAGSVSITAESVAFNPYVHGSGTS